MGEVTKGTTKRVKCDPVPGGLTSRNWKKKKKRRKEAFQGRLDRTWKLTICENEQDDSKLTLSLCAWELILP